MTKLNEIIFKDKFPLNYKPHFKTGNYSKNSIIRAAMLIGEESKKHDISLYGYLNRNVKKFRNSFYIEY